ncbi:MAG: hypothetical protein IPJ31_11950 [Bacteroidetes bacterium]|nr:hypothetical protein [Bacteroidota bacterium]
MKDDVKKYIFGAVAVFLVGVFIWVGIVFVNACGLSFSCKRGELAVARTPIPTMIPATLPAMEIASSASVDPDKCHVAGVELVGAWVEAGSSKTEVLSSRTRMVFPAKLHLRMFRLFSLKPTFGIRARSPVSLVTL